jgi:hypothetical protein
MSSKSVSPLVWFAGALAVSAVVIWLLLAAGWQLGWWLFGGFIAVHGWAHMFAVMPTQQQAAAAGRRFGLTSGETRSLTLPLVGVAIIGFLLAGLATVMGSGLWGMLIVIASLASLAALGFYFSRQLILGIAIDLVLLAIVITGVWRP